MENRVDSGSTVQSGEDIKISFAICCASRDVRSIKSRIDRDPNAYMPLGQVKSTTWLQIVGTIKPEEPSASPVSANTMHRYSILALVPVVLGCTNPDSDPCASYMSANAATASAFCQTYTQSAVTATTGLPAWATYCSSKPSAISKECTCAFSGESLQNTEV